MSSSSSRGSHHPRSNNSPRRSHRRRRPPGRRRPDASRAHDQLDGRTRLRAGLQLLLPPRDDKGARLPQRDGPLAAPAPDAAPLPGQPRALRHHDGEPPPRLRLRQPEPAEEPRVRARQLRQRKVVQGRLRRREEQGHAGQDDERHGLGREPHGELGGEACCLPLVLQGIGFFFLVFFSWHSFPCFLVCFFCFL